MACASCAAARISVRHSAGIDFIGCRANFVQIRRVSCWDGITPNTSSLGLFHFFIEGTQPARNLSNA